MEWVASTLHTTSEHGVSSITTADAHTSVTSSRLNWRPPADLNGLVRFARKTKSGFCACDITFQTQSTGKATHCHSVETYHYAFLINVLAVLICERSASLLSRSAAVEEAASRRWIGGRVTVEPTYALWRSHSLLLLLLLLLLTAVGLTPGGSGYFTCIQNMKLVTNKFKSGGLHEKHVVATWNFGNRLSICL